MFRRGNDVSDPEFNPDKEFIDLVNGNLSSPPLSPEELQAIAEFMQEENTRLRRIIPVLEKHELIPGKVDMRTLTHDRVMSLLTHEEEEVSNFAFRACKLTIALQLANDFKKGEPSEDERALAIEKIKDEIGQALERNPSREAWLLASSEILGDMLPISNNKELLNHEAEQLVYRWKSREIELQNRHPSAAKIREHIAQEIERKFGVHDELEGVVRKIIDVAIRQYHVPEDVALSAEELHEEIMSGRAMEIDPLTLEGLVYSVKKAIRRNN